MQLKFWTIFDNFGQVLENFGQTGIKNKYFLNCLIVYSCTPCCTHAKNIKNCIYFKRDASGEFVILSTIPIETPFFP